MSTPIDSDVLVVGGGVCWPDRASFPRDKPCGEGVMPTGARLLDRLGVLAKVPSEQRHFIRGVGFVVKRLGRWPAATLGQTPVKRRTV
jgi:hypothetical protein